MGHSVAMRRALPLLVLIVLLGCKGNREKDLVGTWSGGSMSTALTEDKKFTTSVGGFNLTGTWKVEGDDVSLQPEMANGKTIAELKTALQAGMARVPAAQKAVAEGALKNIDAPLVYTLSADGKTLTTNKEKDKHAGPGTTLTKA